MVYVVLVVILVFAVPRYLVRKFSSPYTLSYIFGLKGSGKSTLMSKWMLRDIRNGWTVYTNMDDIRIPGVRILKSSELLEHVPEPHSAIYIDEAGLVWDNRSYASFERGFVEYFKLQRKYRNKVIMNSQALDVDKKIRDLIDRMYLVTNLFGCIGFVRPIRRTISVLEATGNSESRLAMDLKFEGLLSVRFYFMPSYWCLFDSFAAPARELASYRQIEGELPERRTMHAQLRELRKAFRRPPERSSDG